MSCGGTSWGHCVVRLLSAACIARAKNCHAYGTPSVIDSTGGTDELLLAANAVKSMHGTIQALLSKDGKTLTMLVRLPLYKEHRHHRHMLRLPQAGNEQAHEDSHDAAKDRSSEKAYDKHEYDGRHEFHDKHDDLGHAD